MFVEPDRKSKSFQSSSRRPSSSARSRERTSRPEGPCALLSQYSEIPSRPAILLIPAISSTVGDLRRNREPVSYPCGFREFSRDNKEPRVDWAAGALACENAIFSTGNLFPGISHCERSEKFLYLCRFIRARGKSCHHGK